MSILAISTFDTNTEGWTPYSEAGQSWSSFGNPTGSLENVDITGNAPHGFNAPSIFLGNQLAAFGGTLNADLYINAVNLGEYVVPDIFFRGSNGLTIGADLNVPVAGRWNPRSVRLDDSQNWRIGDLSGPVATNEQILSVLSNVAQLVITGEYQDGADTAYLDNVILSSGSSISINDVAITEGNSGIAQARFTVSLSNPSTFPISVDYSTQDGTGITGARAVQDYLSVGGTLQFAPGQTSQTIIVPIVGDTSPELDETFFVNLRNPVGAALTRSGAIGTIINNDISQISINDITVIEGKDARAILTVSLSSPSSQPISVNYTTNPINATANNDYTTQIGTLNISANSNTGTIFIPILNDNLNEADEAFTITLSGPVNATLSNDSVGEVTISDTWQSNLTRTLPGGVENLRLIGNNPVNGTGNEGNNVLTGNSANNTLAGLGGNDTYIFAANGPLGQDIISETTTGGSDTLDFSGTNAPIRLNLASITNQTAVTGNLTLKLSANNVIENTSGGNGHDRINGNTLNNSLSGNAGKDTLNGGAGLDYLSGNPGDDLLIGGTGNDSFAYITGKAFISSEIGLDTLTDFTPAADKLILSKTTFSALTSIVGNDFSQSTDFAIVEDDVFVETSAAFIVYSSSSGSLFYNQNGSAIGLGTGSEFTFLADSPTLTRSDFALVV